MKKYIYAGLGISILIVALVLGIVYRKQIFPVKDPVQYDVEYTSLHYLNEENGVIYYLNEEDEVVYEFYHDSVDRISGLFEVCYGGNCGLLDLDLNEVLEPLYQEIHYFEFYDEYFILAKKDDLFYLVDLEGNVFNEQGFDYIDVSVLAALNTIIGNNLDISKDSLGDDLQIYLIAERDGNKGIVDKEGNILISMKYDDIELYNVTDFYFQVELDGKIGIVSLEDEVVLPIIYNYINSDGILINADGKMGYINRSLSVIIEAIYEDVRILNYEIGVYQYLAVKVDGLYGLIDPFENVILPFEYSSIMDTNKEYYIVSKENQFGLVDIDNNIIIPFEYDSIKGLWETYIVEANGKYGAFNVYDKLILPIEYDNVGLYSNMIFVEKDGLWGVVDYDNNVLLPLTYHKLEISYRVDKVGLEVKATLDGESEYIRLDSDD